MRVICLSFSESAEDKKAWSGTVYKVYSSIKNTGCQTDFLCCKVSKTFFEVLVIAFFRILNLFRISSKKYLSGFTIRRRNNIAKFLKQKDFSRYDYVFIIANSVIASAYNKARLFHKDWPRYIFLADSTFSGVENYYSEFSNIHSICSKQANLLSKEAFMYSYKSIVSSDWTKQNCIKDYNVNENKIEVVEFGANIDDPLMGKMKKTYLEKKSFNLLLCGVDWNRKGGDIAVACTKKMIADGFNVTLHIAGMKVPSEYSQEKFIEQHGFLNKNVPEQYEAFVNLLKLSDILLFPSKAECSAIALCEAAGFGLPVICFDTGGLKNYVKNGVNGFRLGIDCNGLNFAETIENLVKKGLLENLNQGALSEYKSVLNWTHWQNSFARIIGLVVNA